MLREGVVAESGHPTISRCFSNHLMVTSSQPLTFSEMLDYFSKMPLKYGARSYMAEGGSMRLVLVGEATIRSAPANVQQLLSRWFRLLSP
jgi:hypothetical protein